MPLRCEGVAGNKYTLRQLLLRLELDLVVGPGQHPNSLCGVLILMRHSIRQTELFGLETGAKLSQRERFPERVHDLARVFAVQSQFLEFPGEQPLLIDGIRGLTGLGEEAGRRENLDPLIGMDNAGSKRDGGDVPFSSGAQAENEPQRSSLQARLIGVRDDGGIEQRRGFQRVFRQKVGADQEPSLFGHIPIRQHQAAHLFEAFQEAIVNVIVPLGKFSGDFIQQRADALFRQRHDPGDDPGNALRIPRNERAQKNA